MKLSAIVPVKSFDRAKSRLDVGAEAKRDICGMMLGELLRTLSESERVDEIVVVSGDRQATRIAREFGAVRIRDESESGVNHAVSMADGYLRDSGGDASVVLPQDVPFVKVQDIDFLLGYQDPPRFLLIVPSRKFDGTNALVRMPVDLMETHYDEDSYRIHRSVGRTKTPNASLVFVRRIMLDIDDMDDLRFALAANEKPGLCADIRRVLGESTGGVATRR